MNSDEAKKIAKELGQKKRQEILTCIKSGKTLGEIAKKFCLDLMVVCEIFTQNINEFYLINSIAI